MEGAHCTKRGGFVKHDIEISSDMKPCMRSQWPRWGDESDGRGYRPQLKFVDGYKAYLRHSWVETHVTADSRPRCKSAFLFMRESVQERRLTVCRNTSSRLVGNRLNYHSPPIGNFPATSEVRAPLFTIVLHISLSFLAHSIDIKLSFVIRRKSILTCFGSWATDLWTRLHGCLSHW